MAIDKTMDISTRIRALNALANLIHIPVSSGDRKGHKNIFRAARIVTALEDALANPLAAHDVYRELERDGFISEDRIVRMTVEGEAIRMRAAFVDCYGALDEAIELATAPAVEA